MPSKPGIAEVDDAHRAIGRYVVEFSRLVFHMRYGLGVALTGYDISRMHAVSTAFGESTAKPIADALFGYIREHGALDDFASKTERLLQKQITAVVQRRNDIAHGDWWIGRNPQVTDLPHPLTLIRIKPSRAGGATTSDNITIADLDAESDELEELRAVVGVFIEVTVGVLKTRGAGSLSEFLAIRSGKVFRLPDGPAITDIDLLE